jgi:saccharopine dehydrogenase-like NADP-dependent oxidoreductase
MSIKTILVLGAGKSASVLIRYLTEQSSILPFHLLVADGNLAAAAAHLGDAPHTEAIQLDILLAADRRNLIARADIVISLMPPALHHLVATDALELGKHVLTASYVDDKMRSLGPEIEARNLLFLCEMGLDPGIDHMSAMAIIDDIHARGGVITEFLSHCGGLVAPESDDNPWHYKISWNPRNVVNAGKAGALYREHGKDVSIPYAAIFQHPGLIEGKDFGKWAFYPNRDSLSYIPLYQLESAHTFLRTTIRHPDFMEGWRAVVELGLTAEDQTLQTNGLSLSHFFAPFSDRISQYNYQVQTQFKFLGWHDEATPINKGVCSYADVLQFAMEKKWVLSKADRDMIIMLHQIRFTLNGLPHRIESSLVVEGEDAVYTAMAKTVGLPLGIAAISLLKGDLPMRGLHIPIQSAIYRPVLAALQQQGIQFKEQETIQAI